MADRYWVGGTASWDGTAGSKWATTSGGAGGASVPTTADDVFFDVLSTGTCTIATGNTGAKSINCTGFAGTVTGTAAITVAGSVTLVAGMTYTHTGTMTLSGTGTLTTAGKTFSGVTVNGSGITVTLGDALNISTRSLTVTQGTFNTANFAVTAGSLSSSNTNIRTITLGSSTITLSANGAVDFTSGANLTFNAGTSQLNLSSLNAILAGVAKTFYNVSFTSTGTGTRVINDANTFNNLTLTASASGMSQLSINANQTVNGTFTCAGSSSTQRGFVRSDTIGTTRTLTCAAVSATDCDFRDITIAGAAAPISPTRGGDCGGNSGITFPAAKTVYWNLTGSRDWNATAWATIPSGSPAVNNFPLAQDTATFTNSGSAGTVAVTDYNIGAIDASARTSAMTLNHNSQPNIYGSYTLGSGVTVSGGSTQSFSGRSTMVFTSAGKTITFPFVVNAPSSTFRLGDAFTSTNSISLTRGTFDAFNYNLTCTTFSSNNTNTRTITMGSGLWTLSGVGTVWTLGAGSAGRTFNKDTANILLSNVSTSSRTFISGDLSYNKLTIGGATGTSVTLISGVCSFTELASTKTVAHTISLQGSIGTIDTWSITGTAGNVVTLNSSLVGTRRTFNLTNVTSGIDYLSVKDIGVNQANRFYVGANSTNGGNNLNVIFTAAPSGAQTLTPALFTNTNTFYLTTITQTGPPQSLLPSLYSNVNTFYAATVAASNEITPDLYDNTNVFYSPIVTIAGGAQTLLPPFYINTNVFYSATVSQPGVQLVGGGGGEDSSSSKPPKAKNKRKTSGFANERAILEAALSANQVAKNVDVLTTSSLAVAKKTAKTLDAYLNEKGTSDALQKQLAKLLAQLSVKTANDQNDNSLNADLKAAANEIQQFLDDEQEAIEILLLDQENDDALLLMAMGF